MSWVDLSDPEVTQEVAAVAARMAERVTEIANDVRGVIQEVIPALRDDERVTAVLTASVLENVQTVLHELRHNGNGSVAPDAAVEYARLLAQRDVPMSPLLRAYRVGQTRFQRDFIAELLRRREGDHVEGTAALLMVERVSGYVDSVVEQLVDVYEQAREEWLSQRSGALAQAVRTVLRERDVDLEDAQTLLGGYRLGQHHVGTVVWCEDGPFDFEGQSALSRVASALAAAAQCAERPVYIPRDGSSAWIWLPLADRTDLDRASLLAAAEATEPRAAVALGEPLAGLAGFRRTHRQALLAHAVALAARPAPSRLTAFADVAPISMMSGDLDAARAWVVETLGALATDDERCSVLRETARVYLENGGSFTATAHQMILHRNTAQYRIRKAEEMRGRPLREGRLDVQLALLACHWFGRAVLLPSESEVERATTADDSELRLVPPHN